MSNQKEIQAPAQRCPYCDDTGDVHTPTGEWRGRCTCPAGTEAPAQAAQSAGEVEREVLSDDAIWEIAKQKCGMLFTDVLHMNKAQMAATVRAAFSHKEPQR